MVLVSFSGFYILAKQCGLVLLARLVMISPSVFVLKQDWLVVCFPFQLAQQTSGSIWSIPLSFGDLSKPCS